MQKKVHKGRKWSYYCPANFSKKKTVACVCKQTNGNEKELNAVFV